MIQQIKFWRRVFTTEFVNPKKLSNEELKNLKEEYAAEISDQQSERKKDELRLKIAIEDKADEQYQDIQIWIENNLKYLKLTVTYLGIFATDSLSKAMIKALFARLKNLEKEFEKIQKPRPMKHKGLPFDQSLILHVRHTMLPIIGQIIPLKQEIESYVQKFFKIN